jgi:hypothetical protein
LEERQRSQKLKIEEEHARRSGMRYFFFHAA